MIVYRITNTVSGKFYIGITRGTMAQRWAKHVYDSRLQNKKNRYLAAAIRKHGREAFKLEILHTVATEAEAPKRLRLRKSNVIEVLLRVDTT